MSFVRLEPLPVLFCHINRKEIFLRKKSFHSVSSICKPNVFAENITNIGVKSFEQFTRKPRGTNEHLYTHDSQKYKVCVLLMATDQLPVETKTMKQNKNMLTRNAFLLHPPPQNKTKVYVFRKYLFLYW